MYAATDAATGDPIIAFPSDRLVTLRPFRADGSRDAGGVVTWQYAYDRARRILNLRPDVDRVAIVTRHYGDTIDVVTR